MSTVQHVAPVDVSEPAVALSEEPQNYVYEEDDDDDDDDSAWEAEASALAGKF